MINIVYKNINGTWYGAAVEVEEVLATAFAQDEREVLKNLLKNLPYKASFQVNEKLSLFSERLLETLRKVCARARASGRCCREKTEGTLSLKG